MSKEKKIDCKNCRIPDDVGFIHDTGFCSEECEAEYKIKQITRNATIEDVDKFDLVFEKRNNYPYLQMKAIRHFREELIEELKKGSD